MNVIVDCPRSSVAEWRFRLFGADVRVKFWFWISTVLLCGAQETGAVLIWVVVCLASILIHEIGHVALLRYYREGADIVLYGWGGLTTPHHHVRGTSHRVVVALAGPMAGLCMASLSLLAAALSGAGIRAGWNLFFPVLVVMPPVSDTISQPGYLYVLLNNLLWVNLYWGLVNLLPIHPLDGGDAARAILEQHDPAGGIRKALILSAATAAVIAVFAMVERNIVLVLAFLILAVSSAQALESEGPRVPRPDRPWRG